MQRKPHSILKGITIILAMYLLLAQAGSAFLHVHDNDHHYSNKGQAEQGSILQTAKQYCAGCELEFCHKKDRISDSHIPALPIHAGLKHIYCDSKIQQQAYKTLQENGRGPPVI